MGNKPTQSYSRATAADKTKSDGPDWFWLFLVAIGVVGLIVLRDELMKDVFIQRFGLVGAIVIGIWYTFGKKNSKKPDIPTTDQLLDELLNDKEDNNK